MWRRIRGQPQAGGYGLLVAAATVGTDQHAEVVRCILRDAGVRATSAPAHSPTAWGGRVQVLVFPEDAPRAYEILCRHTH